MKTFTGPISFAEKPGVLEGKELAQEEAVQHAKLAKDWSDVLETVRAIPQFKDFLRPPSADSILRGLQLDGYVVVLNCHGQRCDAIVLPPRCISANDIVHVELSNVSATDVENIREGIQNLLVAAHARKRGEESKEHAPDPRAARPLAAGKKAEAKGLGGLLKEIWVSLVKPIVVDALSLPVREALVLFVVSH